MKIWAFILLIVLVAEVSADESISSVVYDLKITDENVEGFCLIRGSESIDKTPLSPEWDIEILEEDLVLLKLTSTLQDNDVEIPLLKFPHRVERTLVVVSTRKKFIWKVGSGFYSLKRNDELLVEDEMEMSAISELDSELKNLRGISKSSHHLPENRIYLKEINAGEDVVINAWAGKGYEYSLPYVFGVVILCILLFYAFYFMSKRL